MQSSIIDRNGRYFDRIRSTFYQKTSTISKGSSLLENDDLPENAHQNEGIFYTAADQHKPTTFPVSLCGLATVR